MQKTGAPATASPFFFGQNLDLCRFRHAIDWDNQDDSRGCGYINDFPQSLIPA